VCRLTKSLYGLKEASRQWFAKLSTTILSLGFIQAKSDYSFLTRIQSSSYIVLLVYVDDIAIASNDVAVVRVLTTLLNEKFHLKDLGTLKFFLGLEIAISDKGISSLLQDFGLLASKPTRFSMEQNVKLSKNSGPLLANPTSYRRLIGMLLYLTVIRPNVSY
jgi:hypothetical protein